MSTPPLTPPVWFITGCSTGFGRALARAVVDRGWLLVATARDRSRVVDIEASAPDRVLALDLDVTDPAAIAAAVRAAQERFGRIDVLVNNAGYGYQSPIEEGVEAEIRAQFDANVFGLFAMTRAVLPGMRERRHGHIINITSLAGFVGYQGSGYYASSKQAVEGFSDSLKQEMAPLGIQVTCVEPGSFRTDWAGRSLRQTPSAIADYAETAAKRMETTRSNSGKQAGDPDRAAQAIIRVTEMEKAPRHLVLGAVAVDATINKLKERLAEVESLREVGIAADFPS